jgi:hypothetical protein
LDEDRDRSTLKRVAQALGVSEVVFLENGSSRGEAAVLAISEELELLRLFSRITDPETRRSCLDYVQSLAYPSDMAAG